MTEERMVLWLYARKAVADPHSEVPVERHECPVADEMVYGETVVERVAGKLVHDLVDEFDW